MKELVWKIVAILLLIILTLVFFYRNVQTTSQVDLLVTAVTIKTWKLITVSFFLGGVIFCGIAAIWGYKGKKKQEGNSQASPGSEGSS